jgi:NAD(P)-dependent dehydrogenase (short-subunit alcohol dehydrogenase family)
MSSLAGRNVLVVGASAGVGRAFADRAIRDGANVVLAARRQERLDEIIADAGGGTGVTADVRVDGEPERLVAAAVDLLGGLDLLFYAAGVAPLRHLKDTEADDWRYALETNVIGLQRVLATAVPAMHAGAVAAVLSSETVGRPRPALGAYGASKAAVTESLRAWRLEHPEVRFSCVALGATQPTEFGDAFAGEVLEPVLDVWFKHGLMQRSYMETTDVAHLLADLYASALAYPGVGIEDLTLRSPTLPISGWEEMV